MALMRHAGRSDSTNRTSWVIRWASMKASRLGTSSGGGRLPGNSSSSGSGTPEVQDLVADPGDVAVGRVHEDGARVEDVREELPFAPADVEDARVVRELLPAPLEEPLELRIAILAGEDLLERLVDPGPGIPEEGEVLAGKADAG